MHKSATVAVAALLLLGLDTLAGATTPLARQCSQLIENRTVTFVDAVGTQIRTSMHKNLGGLSSKGFNRFECAGGPNSGKLCPTNACQAAGSVPFECQPAGAITGSIYAARRALSTALENTKSGGQIVCAEPQLDALFGMDVGSARCPNSLNAASLASCIVRSSAAQRGAPGMVSPLADPLALGAPNLLANAAAPTSMSSIALGGLIFLGRNQVQPVVIEPGAITPLTLSTGCPGLCTKGAATAGNLAEPPWAVTTPNLCILTRTVNAGNGTPQSGWIDLATGAQSSLAPTQLEFYGGVCPVCSRATNLCSSGPHGGSPCVNPGQTDIACPPWGSNLIGILALPGTLTTATTTLTIPTGPGVQNLGQALCGACDLTPEIGCTSDMDCTAAGGCGGPGCCIFETAGAFGDPAATVVQTQGVPGPFLPQLAGAFCAGKTGDFTLDSIIGLPGPVKIYRTQLNAFVY